MLPRRDAPPGPRRDETNLKGSVGMDPKEAMLARVPLFAGLKHRDLEQLAMNCDEVDVPSGQVLAREGRSGQEFFVLVEGRVGIDRAGDHLRDLGPGDFFGELALLSSGPRTATATARTECRLLVLTRGQFHTLLTEYPAIQAAVLEAVADRLAALEPNEPR
jgi:CRP/FNR family cyclic AMP-dependent transcriptional regulator